MVAKVTQWTFYSRRPRTYPQSKSSPAKIQTDTTLRAPQQACHLLTVVELVATCGCMSGMKTVSIRTANNRLTELAREVDRGETFVVTPNGRPAFDLVPHRTRKGLRLTIDEFKRKHRVKAIFPYIADDFDEPFPEDFLVLS
jgi:prevent-host-death family protein